MVCWKHTIMNRKHDARVFWFFVLFLNEMLNFNVFDFELSYALYERCYTNKLALWSHVSWDLTIKETRIHYGHFFS